jgi:hypothetical protein
VIYSHFTVLSEKFAILHSKHKVFLNGIQQMLFIVTNCKFLVDYNGTVFSIFECVCTSIFFDISYFFIIDIIKVSIVDIILVVFEVCKPGFIIGQNFPISFPQFATDSSWVVSVDKHKIQFITVFIIFAESAIFIEL